MKVSELITFLQTQSPDLDIAYSRYSEQCLMELHEIHLFEGCSSRPDGWIQNVRPDKPSQFYLVFPGN